MLLLFSLCAQFALATPAVAPRPAPADPPAEAAARLGAERYARYLAAALDLSAPQAQAVQQLAADQALAARHVPAATAQAQFERGLLQVLSPGQYNAYAWLSETLPR